MCCLDFPDFSGKPLANGSVKNFQKNKIIKIIVVIVEKFERRFETHLKSTQQSLYMCHARQEYLEESWKPLETCCHLDFSENQLLLKG